MRLFAGAFFLSIFALSSLAAPNSCPSVDLARGATPVSFIPAKTLVPPPVPTDGPGRFRLKVWTEQDAIAAISEGEKLLAEAEHSDGFYEEDAARLYLTTIMQETFMRFPATQSQDKILWVYIREEVNREFTYGLGVAADRFLRALEKALNTAQVKTENLASWLEERGFTLVSGHPAHNFHGDGQEALLLQIERQRLILPSDLLVIVEGARPGEYHLTSVKPNWRGYVSTQGGFQEIAVKDHNGNGRPEISSVIAESGHAACHIWLELYEWEGERANGHFENTAEDAAGFWEGIWGDYFYRDCVGIWEFGTPDSKGAQPLFQMLRRHNPAGKPCWDYEFRERYEWDGQKYTWVSGDADPPYPGQSAKCFAD